MIVKVYLRPYPGLKQRKAELPNNFRNFLNSDSLLPLQLGQKARDKRLLLASIHTPLKHGSIEGVGEALCFTLLQVSGDRTQPRLVRLAVLGSAQAALVGAGTGAGRAAPAVALGRQVTNALTTQLREITRQALIVHDGTRLAAANVLDLVGVELRGSVVEANSPAARLVIKHTTIKVDFGDVISAWAAEVGRHSTQLEGSQWIVTSHVGDTDRGNAGARAGVVQL